jgi:hypothetical protein
LDHAAADADRGRPRADRGPSRRRRDQDPGGRGGPIEQLPLQDPRRTAVEQDRRDLIQFGWKHAETQPRLTLKQAGQSGVLQVAVKLRLK